MRTRTIGAAALSFLVIAAVGLPLSASAQPGRPGTEAVKKYLVQTRSVSAAGEVAGDVAKSGGKVNNVYSRAFAGFAATLTADQVHLLKSNGRVKSITADAVFHSTTIQDNPTWGLDRIDQRDTSGDHRYGYSTTGTGVTAFVVDTGIGLTHQQFGGRAKSGYDFVDYDNNASDCHGHGTHVSGTIGGSTYGVAKGVKLVAVRVLDCNGSGWASDIIDALDWVIAHKTGPSVVNMSIGGDAFDPLDEAVERTVAAGITVVVAAGNDGGDACDSSPARAPDAITVAATDSDDWSPSWSNVGSCVDLFAPGVDVKSASNSSNTATEVMSGTSMASPHVAGLAARYLEENPQAAPEEVADALTASATENVVQDAGDTPNLLAYAVAPDDRAPGVATKVTVSTKKSAKKATMKWGVPSDDGGDAVTHYRVARNGKDSQGVGPRTVIVSAKSRSYTFSRLRKGFSYTLSVSAINSVGTGVAVTKKVKL